MAERPLVAPRARNSAGVPGLAIVVGIVALIVTVWSPLALFDAGMTGGVETGPIIAAFFTGAILLIGIVVISIIGLTRRGHRALWVIALIIGLGPVIAFIALWLALGASVG